MQESKKIELELAVNSKQGQINRIAQMLTKLVAKQKKLSKLKADKITDEIYLGCYSAACNKEFLEEEGIKRVIMCLSHLNPPYPDLYSYKQIPVKDHEGEDIAKHFQEAFEFIEQSIQKKEKILIHCFAGVSRSTTILIAYFIKKERKQPIEILGLLREKRSIVNPNSGFMRQLQAYYEHIISTVQQVQVETKAQIKPDQIEQIVEIEQKTSNQDQEVTVQEPQQIEEPIKSNPIQQALANHQEVPQTEQQDKVKDTIASDVIAQDEIEKPVVPTIIQSTNEKPEQVKKQEPNIPIQTEASKEQLSQLTTQSDVSSLIEPEAQKKQNNQEQTQTPEHVQVNEVTKKQKKKKKKKNN